jgi:uncharacterized membrane protein YoaK (UPF0700 family)
VTTFFADVRHTLVPGADDRHGPLPPLLVGLTLVTGLVDAYSYLVLGHVFVANMTGNVIFLGFALAGATGFSLTAALTALAAFWVGALAGGAFGSRLAAHRGRLLTSTTAFQAGLVVVAVVLTIVSGNQVGAPYRYPLIGLLAVAMGLQNATARRLAVPDLTTTVLTLTITGTAADSAAVGGRGSSVGRRVISVGTMFVGALIGALLVIHVRITLPLAAALAVLVTVTAGAAISCRSQDAWVHP